MKTSTIALCLVGATPLAACDRIDTSFQAAPIKTDTIEGKIRSRRTGGEEVRTWRDPETGCQYLLWERKQRGAMTPRLAADGRPLCNR
jgi:hypothetical protein